MKPGPMLYAGALLLIFHCARRKPDMVTDKGSILVMDARQAWTNYMLVRERLKQDMPHQPRVLLEQIARCSEEQFFRMTDQAPSLIPWRLLGAGAWLDRASDQWKAKRRAKGQA